MASNDLIDAVIATLELNSAVTTAFGDTWDQATQTGIPKFFADVAGQVPEPYAVLTELGETYDYMTSVPNGMGGSQVSFTSPGQMQFDIWALDRYQLRTLGMAIASALNDDALVWIGGEIMIFRLTKSFFVRSPGQAGVTGPIAFHRIFIFEYMYSGVMP